VYGPEASGKTTLALHVIAEAQKLGGGGKPKTSYLTSISYSAFFALVFG
jgi:RecA/RadA recombinase